MFLTLKELVRWLNLSVFEIWAHIISIYLFSILLALKLDGVIESSWLMVLSPLVICELVNAYFNIIVIIRMYFDAPTSYAVFRGCWSFIYCFLFTFFKYRLYKRLNGEMIEALELLAPIFIVTQLMCLRACRLG